MVGRGEETSTADQYRLWDRAEGEEDKVRPPVVGISLNRLRPTTSRRRETRRETRGYEITDSRLEMWGRNEQGREMSSRVEEDLEFLQVLQVLILTVSVSVYLCCMCSTHSVYVSILLSHTHSNFSLLQVSLLQFLEDSAEFNSCIPDS
jgi:hypothetical protein